MLSHEGTVSPSVGGVFWRHRLAIGLVAAIVAGIAFRLIWIDDIEYKGDEAWMVDYVRAFWHTGTWSLVGMISSAGPGLPHPGLGPWLFLAISAFLPSAGPLELVRSIEAINIITIILMVLFARYAVDRSEREPWLWAVALMSVNPLAVIYSRKLWAMDTLPLFTLVMLCGWWYRDRRWGAFVWGLVGALLGQIHLTGFVFAAPFLGVVLFFDRRSTRWLAWFAGSLLGAIPLLPWLVVIAEGIGPLNPAHFNNPIVPFGHWINFALGIDLFKALGDDFTSFLGFPKIGLYSSYLATLLLAGIVVIFAILMRRLIHQFHLDRRSTAALLLGTRTPTSLALDAGLIGYCALLAVMSQPTYLHYMIIALPLLALWVAWIARVGAGPGPSMVSARRLLAALVVSQAGVTMLFLAYIHQTQVIHGDYGTTYGSQRPAGLPR
jgi:hypothetical protein